MRRKAIVRTIGAAILSSCLALILPATTALADPPPTGTLCGVGGETTQDVMQGLASLSGGRIENWHASGSQDIVCRGVTITRPRSDAEGLDALFRSMGANIPVSAPKPVPVGSGIIGFARSAAQPPAAEVSASGDVIYVPFGLDAVTFATDNTPISPLNGVSLTLAQLNTLYEDCGTVTVPGGTLNPSQSGGNVDLFLPQIGSVTRAYWQSVVAPAGFGACVFDRFNASGQPVTSGGTPVQEHDGTVTSLNTSAVTPFRIPSWVAQANDMVPERRHDAALHQIAGVNPITGSGTIVGTNPLFPVTRPVFNVVPAAQVAGPPNTSVELAFIGTSSAVCTNTATITDYGFIDLSANTTDPWTCGGTTLRAYPDLLP